MSTQKSNERPDWPQILDRYVDEVARGDREHTPQRLTRRYHGLDVQLWYGRVHVSAVDGWVENIRLKHFLNRWRARIGDPAARPSTDDIYDIMIEADREESAQAKKPFHIERIAGNIADNGVQEPIFLYSKSDGTGELWDGNRRFYGTLHIMRTEKFAPRREQAQWIPAYIYQPSGDPTRDAEVKKRVLTELNFKEKDHIPWPNYVKAGEVYDVYQRLVAADPDDPSLRRAAKEQIAEEYGLKTWRTADRWVKMYGLALDFKEYYEGEQGKEESDVDLVIQDKFEYFDELTKAGVWGSLSHSPDDRDEVFRWLWDGKLKAFTDVRKVPGILADPVSRIYANEDDDNAVKRAIEHLIANDPGRTKDKTAANLRIKQFGEWLDQFRREDFKKLDREALEHLRGILQDIVKMLSGLLEEGEVDAKPDTNGA